MLRDKASLHISTPEDPPSRIVTPHPPLSSRARHPPPLLMKTQCLLSMARFKIKCKWEGG